MARRSVTRQKIFKLNVFVALSCAVLWVGKLCTRYRATRLVLIFVSDRVPDIEKYDWMPLLSLQSFITAFGLPSKHVRAEARFYISCGNSSLDSYFHRPTLLSDSYIESDFVDYVDIFTRLKARYGQYFSDFTAFCSNQLSQAVCHTESVVGTRTLTFLLEHDWILFPSQFQKPLLSIGMSLFDTPFEYALLQRGDRLAKRWHKGSVFGKTRLYSNNPHLATGAFLRKLKQHGFCNEYERNWERKIESYCKTSKCKLALVSSKLKTSLYHMDGRFFSFAANHSVGPIFDGTFSQKSFLQMMYLNPEMVISRIERVCAELADQCDPYFLRHVFATMARDFAVQHGLQENYSSHHIVAKYVGSTDLAQLYLRGQFPHGILQD
mmetsp:Transcript_1939/g.6276  ORF Transcript_1939/g.6276 Transcript_1939/m.6276 type:complete len:380 (-) Transcript_1939:211-1350(-)